jgi:hypothetical protein
LAKIFILEDEIDTYPRNQIPAIFADHTMVLARSREEAGNIWIGNYDLMLFDHDMRGFFDPSTYPNTGYMFLANLCQSRGTINQLKHGIVMLHSQNTEGRQNMSDLLTKHAIPHESHFFGPSYLQRLRIVEKELDL